MNDPRRLESLRQRVELALHHPALLTALSPDLGPDTTEAAPSPRPPPDTGTAAVQRLLEELRLYQAELEAQNLELVEAQRQLSVTAHQYRTLFDALPIPALVVDDRAIVIQANQRSRNLFQLEDQIPCPLRKVRLQFEKSSQFGLVQAMRQPSSVQAVTRVVRMHMASMPASHVFDVHVLPLGQDYHLDQRHLLMFVNRTAEQAHEWMAQQNALLLTLRKIDDHRDRTLLESAGSGLLRLCEADAWVISPTEAPSPSTESTILASPVPASLARLDLPGWLRSLMPLLQDADEAMDSRQITDFTMGSTSRSQVHLLMLRLPVGTNGNTHANATPAWVMALVRRDRAFLPAEITANHLVAEELGLLLERNLRQRALHRLSRAINQSSEGVLITNALGLIRYVNPGGEYLCGRPRSELLGQPADLLDLHHDHAALKTSHWPDLLKSGPWSGEVMLRRPDGEYWPAWLQLSSVSREGSSAGEVLGTLQDLRQRKADQQRIHHLAFYDALTGLPNRRLLQDRLRRAMARQRRADLCGVVFFIDLDDFKRINDALGHDQGDCLLQHVAHQISACLRENDTVARLGGDEFVVLTELTDTVPPGSGGNRAKAAEQIAQKLALAIALPVSLRGQRISVTPSIGIALLGDSARTAEDVLRQADLAMYKAKGAGRGGIRFFSPAMQAEAEARARLEADLAEALERRQFRLHFQPQVNAHGQVVGCEGLLRWQCPGKGLMLPSRFIQVAENSGSILPIGRWVIEQSCQQLASWQQLPRRQDWTLAVNLSARQFRDSGLLEWIAQCLERHGVQPGRLELELTESTLIDDLDEAVAKMQQLRELGVLLSLDDFGTGYSSLAYLQRLPLHKLKIDQRFVQRLPEHSADGVIARTIIGLADNLGLKALAEGVETEAQRDCLSAAGCQLFQGFLFAKPQPEHLLPL